MPTTSGTTYAPGYGGTFTIGGTTLPVTNVTVEYSRGEMDVTSFSDGRTYVMAGRITRKASCSALISADTLTVLTAVMENPVVIGTKAALSWTDANSTAHTMTVMCSSATKTYDNSGAAIMQFQFTEAYAT